MFLFVDDALRLSDALISRYREVEPAADNAQLVMIFLITKSRVSAKAALQLLKNGFRLDAQCVLRAIFETILNMTFIMQQDNPNHWAERYVEFQIVSSLSYAKKAIKHGKNAELVEKAIERKGECEKELSELKEKYGKDFGEYPHTWHGRKIKEVAKDCKMETHYDIVYSIWSDFVHTSIQSSRNYTEEINGEIRVFERLDYKCDAELASLYEFLMITNERLNKEFKLGAIDKIEALNKRFVKFHK